MNITFHPEEQFEGWEKFPAFIEKIITHHSLKRLCEVGAGANPAIRPEFVRAHRLHYKAVDSSSGEVLKSRRAEASVFDVCVPNTTLPDGPFDLICSRMTAEHFQNSEHAYRNMLNALAPGGLSVHSFATLYISPFLLNRILPGLVSDLLLNLFAPRNRERHDKFKAYYSHCRGPLPSQLAFFRQLGYEIVEYRAYFGHRYYEAKLPLLHYVQQKVTRLLLKAPKALFTSYATVILRRPTLFCKVNPPKTHV